MLLSCTCAYCIISSYYEYGCYLHLYLYYYCYPFANIKPFITYRPLETLCECIFPGFTSSDCPGLAFYFLCPGAANHYFGYEPRDFTNGYESTYKLSRYAIFLG